MSLLVYFNEFNVVCGKYRYLPYNSGLLRAYAETDSLIREHYEFAPFIYEMDSVANVLVKYTKPPDVAAFSVSMWNEQLNLVVAKEVKARWPHCLIVFGGCHVPHHSESYMMDYPFVDVCVKAEGEEAFREILRQWAGTWSSFSDILGITFRRGNELSSNVGERPFVKDLDKFPSPYLTSLFDELLNDGHQWQAIIETNRGCPFDCSFCLVSGTKVITMRGERSIEEIRSGDRVLGWNEENEEAEWGVVHRLFQVGSKSVIRVKAGDFNVEATEDHPFYTRRGWVRAGELRSGDEVLSCLWKTNFKSEESLLPRVSICSCFPVDDSAKSDEEKRCSGETSEVVEGVYQERGSYPLHVYSEREEGDRGYCQEEAIRPRQSDEACGCSCEDGGDKESSAFSSYFKVHDRTQPYAELGGSGASSELVERPGSEEKVSGVDEVSVGFSPKQIREESDCILGGESSSLPICGGLFLLAGSMQIGEVPESGLYSYSNRSEEDHFSPRSLLAPRSEGGEKRIEGLHEQGLGMLRSLGQRIIGQTNGREDTGVCWVRVNSVERVGVREVYDLANVSPLMNFFANGILVHNCYWAQGGLALKYKFHGMDYVKAEMDWCGKNHIPYVFGADCLAEGTSIDTPVGTRVIESLLPGDLVYGYNADSNELVLNTILASQFAGIKQVLRIGLENGSHVEASENHRFYTKKGWKRVAELNIGDEVLFGMWQSFEEESEVLFPGMLLQSGGAGFQETTGFGEIERSREAGIRSKVGGWKGREATYCCTASEGSREIQGSGQDGPCEEDCKWGGGSESGDSQEKPCGGEVQELSQFRSRGQELDEADNCGFSGTDSPFREGEGHSQEVRLLLANGYKSSVSSDVSRQEETTHCQLEEEDAKVLGRSRMACQAFSQGRRTPQWIREQSCQISREVQSSVSVRGESDLVDRAMPIGGLSQSGFHPCGEGSSEGSSGSRSVLASGRGVGQVGGRGLLLHGVGDADNLGRYSLGQGIGGEDSLVCWRGIISILPIGEKRTYDLIEASPTHNFFAGGILVSNSNWGMHHRDRELSEYMVETKKKYGFPDKFRVCFGKNTDEKIFQVASILHTADLEKGITLARQSNDEQTLKNIRRDNIKLSTYRNLQVRFNDLEVPVYSELILGLPGETVESWKRGINELLTSGLRNQLFIYLCQILPNTELANSNYRKIHGIQSRRIKLTEIHGAIREEGWVDEYEDIVTATTSMPHEQWREMVKFSWATMFLHSMKAGFFVLGWLWDRFKIPPSEFISFVQDDLSKSFGWDGLLDKMLEGEGRGAVLPAYGSIYWDVEEAALLQATETWPVFFYGLEKWLRSFLAEEGHPFPESKEIDEVDEVVMYQIDRIPEPSDCLLHKWEGYPRIELPFQWNIPEYFDKLGGSAPITLERKPQKLILKPREFLGDREKFARETVLWGRKSGTMLVPCEWENIDV